MALILEEGQICPYGSTCPYNKEQQCWGAKNSRKVRFKCSFVKNGKIIEGGMRHPLDQTGDMKIIVE